MVLQVSRLRLCEAEGLCSGYSFLLPSPGVVVGGVTYIMVDKGVGLLSVWVDLVLTVTALKDKTETVLEISVVLQSIVENGCIDAG